MTLPPVPPLTRRVPAMRFEAHFSDRVVRCFAVRPSSIDQMFRETVERHGERDAIVEGSVTLSYSALAEAVDRTADGLRLLGIVPGDRIALLIGNRIEFIVVLLAAQSLRAVAVPISIREQAPGIAYVLTHCSARMLIHERDLQDRLPHGDQALEPTARISLDSADWDRLQASSNVAEDRQVLPGSEEATAVILYTSGTTDRPKGARLSHLNLVHSVLNYESCMNLTHLDRSAVAVPMSHVTGLVAMVLTMVRVGGALVLVKRFAATSFMEMAAAQRITHTILVPAMYQLCLLEPGLDQHDLRSWRIGAYGGAPMPRASIEALAQALPDLTLMNAYGATETTSPATIMPLGLQADHLDSVGQPVPGGDIRVMDENGCEVPPGTSGELWIAGPMVVDGYWADPQATAASFTGGYWRSGDIGSIDEQGFVSVFDRRKDMLNRGGYKIYSVEVENAILGVEGVKEAAVVGRPCPVLGERVHAVVCVNEDLAAGPGECIQRLRAHCTALLADYKVPETWVIQSGPLPRNPNGKLLKRELRPR